MYESESSVMTPEEELVDIEHEGRSCVLCPAEWFTPLDWGTVDDEKLITVGRKVLEQYREAFIKLGKNEE